MVGALVAGKQAKLVLALFTILLCLAGVWADKVDRKKVINVPMSMKSDFSGNRRLTRAEKHFVSLFGTVQEAYTRHQNYEYFGNFGREYCDNHELIPKSVQ